MILFLLVFLPLLLIVAVVVDFSQTLVVKRQLSSAVDSAALALGALPDIQEAEALSAKAKAYIDAHYPESAIGSLTSWSAVRDGDMINVSATAEIPTAFLGVTGVDNWTVTVNSGVFRTDKQLEVVMVLDNSGSMASGGKMTAMQNAATDLVDILFGDDETSDKIRVGLVPFTAGVNVNVPFETTDWLDKNNKSVISDEVITNLTPTESIWTVLESMQGGMANWGGCLRSRMGPHDIQDTEPNPLVPNTLFAAHFNPFRGPLKAPYAGQPGGSQNQGCPPATIQGLTNVKSTITSALDAMTANGNTNIPEGLAWGWRLISPNAPFTGGAAYSDPNTIKAIIVLTDGENNVSGQYSSYGVGGPGNPHLLPNVNAGLNAKLTALCENIKGNLDGIDDGDDIIIYTIAFAVSGSILDRMNSCATSPSTAFRPDTLAQLTNAFGEIAASLSQLRLAQ